MPIHTNTYLYITYTHRIDMKQLNIFFDDEDYQKILEVKNKMEMSWREFIIKISSIADKEISKEE